jgi:Lanthionine synthetase C-like protein
LAPGDDALTEVLVAGGELTRRAGPLIKGAGLCHGTAGNGYAFLKLFERTGDERWLARARKFAMHAIEQVERARQEYGQARNTLCHRRHRYGDLSPELLQRGPLDAHARRLLATSVGRHSGDCETRRVALRLKCAVALLEIARLRSPARRRICCERVVDTEIRIDAGKLLSGRTGIPVPCFVLRDEGAERTRRETSNASRAILQQSRSDRGAGSLQPGGLLRLAATSAALADT